MMKLTKPAYGQGLRVVIMVGFARTGTFFACGAGELPGSYGPRNREACALLKSVLLCVQLRCAGLIAALFRCATRRPYPVASRNQGAVLTPIYPHFLVKTRLAVVQMTVCHATIYIVLNEWLLDGALATHL